MIINLKYIIISLGSGLRPSRVTLGRPVWVLSDAPEDKDKVRPQKVAELSWRTHAVVNAPNSQRRTPIGSAVFFVANKKGGNAPH